MPSSITGKEPIKDLTLFFSDVSFWDPKLKNELWISQFLFYAKQNSVQFLDPKRMHKYRKLEKGELDENEYKEMLDPKTPMGEGGKAEYIAADFKTCPVDVHLDNIVRARIDKVGSEYQLQVNEIDKFAKTQKQRDKEKITYQHIFRDLINDINKNYLGLPELSQTEDPYAYVQSLQGSAKEKVVNSGDTILDYIKSQIKDSQDIALYETYLYKGDIERAFELGIQHYLINLNKWSIKCEAFNNDIKHFNKACGRWYTDETTGRGVVEYLEPDRLYTSAFKSKIGEDIQYWFYEYDVTFSDFVRMFGMKLDDEQLKEVFELNKSQGAVHGLSWSKSGSVRGSNARIRIGIFSVLTQDAEKFGQKYANDKIPSWKPQELSWLPSKNTPNKYKETPENKIYNVWYSCYYVPPPQDKLANNSAIDWAWQSRYIFNLKKDIDMYRWGVDARYAKSTLVIWKDESRMSYTDIKEAFMPKIRSSWHKFQNCLIQDTTALAMSRDFLGGMLKAVDESNKNTPKSAENNSGSNGKDATVQSFRMLKQGGMAFFDFRDSQGNLVTDPSKLFVYVDSKHLDKAERLLKLILEQYNLMTMALAQNDISEGQDPKPRTPVAGVNAALAAVREGIWFIEKPVREFLVMFGERCVQFLLYMVKEKKKYGYINRWEEFQSVVGMANSWLLDSVEEMQPEEIGITVSLEDTNSKKQYYVELTTQMLKNGEIGLEDVEMIVSTIEQNYKYGAVLLVLAAKKKAKEKADMEELAHERQKEIQQGQLQIALALNSAKGQAKDKNIQTQGEIDARLSQIENALKQDTMSKQKNQLLNNKLEQQQQAADLDMQKSIADKAVSNA